MFTIDWHISEVFCKAAYIWHDLDILKELYKKISLIIVAMCVNTVRCILLCPLPCRICHLVDNKGHHPLWVPTKQGPRRVQIGDKLSLWQSLHKIVARRSRTYVITHGTRDFYHCHVVDNMIINSLKIKEEKKRKSSNMVIWWLSWSNSSVSFY